MGCTHTFDKPGAFLVGKMGRVCIGKEKIFEKKFRQKMCYLKRNLKWILEIVLHQRFFGATKWFDSRYSLQKTEGYRKILLCFLDQ